MPLSPQERYRQVAGLHAGSLDQGFLATLGVQFLSLMYQAIDRAPGSVLLTEEQDGRVLGFVSGGSGMRSIYRLMLRQPLRLMAALAPSVVRPSRFRRMLETVRYSRGVAKPSGWPEAELLSIAVEPGMRGTGLAERLYRRLENHFIGQGVPAFRIIVGQSLAPAHRFYQRMGAVPLGSVEVHAGQASTVYVHRLPDKDVHIPSDPSKSESP